MSHGTIRFGALAVALACGLVPALAAHSVYTPRGDLLIVEEVSRNPEAPSLALRWSLHRADGGVERGIVPGTWDRARDVSPSLALDPDSGDAVLVWSRHNGTDFDLVLSTLEGRTWSEPIPLVSGPDHEIQPTVFTAPGEGIHVAWRYPGERDAFWYALFRPATGVAVVGPERITLAIFTGGPLTEGGGDDPGIQPGTDCPPDDLVNCLRRSPGSCDRACRESASPVDGLSSCRGISIVAPIGDSLCAATRDETGWHPVACATAGTVDLRAALESLAAATCRR
ncbi:MAG: sialidase family protein [Acidobacteriota bacterium]|jgi:hypothetical protein